MSCPWKEICWKWGLYFVDLESKCLDLDRKCVEREMILLSLIEISLDLDSKFVEREANFVCWILHHLAFHSQQTRLKDQHCSVPSITLRAEWSQKAIFVEVSIATIQYFTSPHPIPLRYKTCKQNTDFPLSYNVITSKNAQPSSHSHVSSVLPISRSKNVKKESMHTNCVAA